MKILIQEKGVEPLAWEAHAPPPPPPPPRVLGFPMLHGGQRPRVSWSICHALQPLMGSMQYKPMLAPQKAGIMGSDRRLASNAP